MSTLGQFLTISTQPWQATGRFCVSFIFSWIPHFSHSNSSHNHYDTDFPELTSKFESFGLHSGEAPATQNIPDLF